MGRTEGWAFIGLASLDAILALLALFQLGVLRLESSGGRLRDGLMPGAVAPRWVHSDATGRQHEMPNGKRWRLLVFADHSLAEFPDLVAGIRSLHDTQDTLEVLGACHTPVDFAEAGIRLLGLTYPVLAVGREFYLVHNVHAMPFVMFVDPSGIVGSSGLVNDAAQLLALWRRAGVASDSATTSQEFAAA